MLPIGQPNTMANCDDCNSRNNCIFSPTFVVNFRPKSPKSDVEFQERLHVDLRVPPTWSGFEGTEFYVSLAFRGPQHQLAGPQLDLIFRQVTTCASWHLQLCVPRVWPLCHRPCQSKYYFQLDVLQSCAASEGLFGHGLKAPHGHEEECRDEEPQEMCA